MMLSVHPGCVQSSVSLQTTFHPRTVDVELSDIVWAGAAEKSEPKMSRIEIWITATMLGEQDVCCIETDTVELGPEKVVYIY